MKPRTTLGWKGLLYDPHLDGSYNIAQGLRLTRQLFLTLAEMQVPTATECVEPILTPYFEDLLTWGFIGARTCASPPHRELASALDLAMGIKNSLDGSLQSAIHGIVAARAPHALVGMDEEGRLSAVQSEGNPYTHLVLRGSTASPNCDAPSVQHAMQLLRHAGLAPRVMLDCSHGNSGRQWERQKGVLLSALDQIEQGHCDLFGLMLESHLHSGNQVLREDPSSLRYAVSITDPCLDWETTEELVLQAHSRLSKREAPRAGVATLCTPPHCP